MAMAKIGMVVAAVMLGACASSGAAASGAGTTTAATTPENPSGAACARPGEGEHHHGQHIPPTMSPQMVAFHDVMRPLWHSEPGAARDGRTCEQAATLRARAGAVAEAPVPEAARAREQGWRTTAAQLVATSDALVAACGATPRGNVGDALAAVHTAFHGLIDHMGHEHH